MKRLMRIHRYLSCFVAPAMLFFALSGAWQAFRLQDSRKDGSYVAPIVLSVLSDIHKASEVSGPGGLLFRGGQVLLAGGFAATAVIGLVTAYRLTRPARFFWISVAAGVVMPIVLALLRG